MIKQKTVKVHLKETFRIAHGATDEKELIITEIDGEKVVSVEEFTRVLYSSEIGEQIEITYWRGNSKATVTVVPTASPAPQ